jgi:predicted DNA-binding protein (MmcQ/YjbR family)
VDGAGCPPDPCLVLIAPTPTLPRKRGRANSELALAVKALRKFALGHPQAAEDFPWGERTIKVRGKIFAFLSEDGEKLYLTVKLPQSSEAALGLPFASPTGYRLGRSGWVSARFPKGSAIPLDMFRDWIEESYRAVAPAGLIKTRLGPR